MTKATRAQNQLSSRFDLRQLANDVLAQWREIQRWPILAWLAPLVPVRLIAADGQETTRVVESTGVKPGPVGKSAARFTAIELPEGLLLLRRLSLPPLSPGELAQAVALDVSGASPFPPDDVVWGYTTRVLTTGLLEMTTALASRTQVEDFLKSTASSRASVAQPEVWAVPIDAAPIVFNGFGEKRRLAYAAVRQRMAFGLLLLSVGLMTAIALTPVAQLRMRAIEAVRAFDVLSGRTASLVRDRASLLRTLDKAAALKEILAQRADPLHAFEVLTQALPDDTSLLSLQVQGTKVTINGATSNAASLMQQLSTHPELREVKAPAAATRPLGASKDSFNIELILAAKSGSAASPAAPAAGMPPAVSSSQQPGSAGAPVAPAPAAATASAGATPQAVQAPRAPGGASFGGATFGAAAASTQPARSTRTAP